MILYHGSNMVIDKIDLSKSKPFKDFGRGFYLSDSQDQALEMAKFKVSLLEGNPVISIFELDKGALFEAGLKTLIFDDYTEDWLDFVIKNREGGMVEQYDFVYGPIADDKVGLQLRRYKDGNIDKKELMQRLKYMKGITFQYYFGTEASIKFLKKI